MTISDFSSCYNEFVVAEILDFRACWICGVAADPYIVAIVILKMIKQVKITGLNE